MRSARHDDPDRSQGEQYAATHAPIGGERPQSRAQRHLRGGDPLQKIAPGHEQAEQRAQHRIAQEGAECVQAALTVADHPGKGRANFLQMSA